MVLVSDGKTVRAGPDEAGDEPVELARAVPGLVVAVSSNRVSAGRTVVRELGEHVFILDDGFQHLRLARDLDLVCVDAEEDTALLRLLPAGRLREPLRALGRADALVWTRWREGLPKGDLGERVEIWLEPGKPIFRAASRISAWVRLGPEPERLPVESLTGEPLGLLSAIARPDRFGCDVEALGARVVMRHSRRDHHRWGSREVLEAVGRARLAGARAVVTTRKDAVKLEAKALGGAALPLYYAEQSLEVLETEAFGALLGRTLARP
jgi:tetraacyldisaccharide 4'-kinase